MNPLDTNKNVTANNFDATAVDIKFHIRKAHRLRSEVARKLFARLGHALFAPSKELKSRLTFQRAKHV